MKIGDVAKFQNGFAFKSSDFKKNGKFPIIKIKELKDGEVKFFSDSVCVDVDLDAGYRKFLVQEGDVLFALTGDPVNKPNPLSWVGRVSVYNHKEEALINQRVCKLLPTKKVNPKYIYYFFRDFENFYRLASLATGSASQANISTKAIENVEIDIPPINVQNRMIEYLDAISKKIEINNQINDNLEQQAQVYFDKTFIVNPDPSWKVGYLSDIGTIVAGGTPSKAKTEYYSEDGIPWITPKDLSNNKSKFIYRGETDISELGFSKSSATKMPRGTVLFSSRAPIGYIAIAANEVTTNQGFKSVIPNDDTGTAFTYFMLKYLLPTIENMASGSTFKEISGAGMKNVPLVIPDSNTIKKFNNFCEPIFEQQAILEKENIRLFSLRDTLLPKLMSGELDVSDIEI